MKYGCLFYFQKGEILDKIKFLNDSNVYDVSLQISRNIAVIEFTDMVPAISVITRGFQLLNEHNLLVQGEYGAYTTIYRTYEDNEMKFELSNDGSVYVPPVVPDPLPEPEPYIPTYEEILNNKINELSSVCQQTIEAGLDIDGLHYSYSEKDQINLNDIVSTVKLTGLPLGYHADGQNCTEYSADELMNIYIQLAMNKYCQQTYFNQSREYLKSLEESETNKEIIEGYIYGTPLAGIYLETYNAMVALYNAQIQSIISNSDITDTK